jgi:hypothetical protein
MVRALAAHDVRWVMWGSQVLALHGADLAPNDLDIVPDLDPANLARLGRCLDALDATPAIDRRPGAPMATLEGCLAWRSDRATPENLDHLFVTRLGMLDVVIAFADPYPVLRAGASLMTIDGDAVQVCDPRRVLLALEGRDRRKDVARRDAYAEMRSKFAQK